MATTRPNQAIRDNGRILSASFTSDAVIQGNFDFIPSPYSRGSALYCQASVAGTLDIYYVNFNNDLALLLEQAVAANDLTVVIFAQPTRRLSVTFTPEADPAGTETVWVDALSNGFA